MDPAAIRKGSYYYNGVFGLDWQVRQVTEYSDSGISATNTDDNLSYKVIAGKNRRHIEITNWKAFAEWARYEVCLDNNSWQRVEDPSCPTGIENAA